MNFARALKPVAAAMVCGVATLAFAADQTKEFASFIKAEVGRSQRAFEKRDAKYFESISTKDFVYINHQGQKQNLKQSIDGMKQMFAISKGNTVTMKILSATAKDGIGISKSVETHSIKVDNPQTKKLSTMVAKVTTTTKWKKVGNTWKVFEIKETAAPQMSVDGKPMQSGG